MHYLQSYSRTTRSFFLLLILSFIAIASWAQDETQQQAYKAIGVDFTFINNFIPLENQIGSRSNYDLFYITANAEGKFMRHAVDFDIRLTSSDETNVLSNNTNTLGIDYKFGLGKHKKISTKFEMTYGLDILTSYFYTKSKGTKENNDNYERVSKSQSYLLGTGPFCGLKYNITGSFSLYTEMGYYVSFRGLNTENYTSQNQNFKDEKKTTDLGTNIVFPTSLVLFYQF